MQEQRRPPKLCVSSFQPPPRISNKHQGGCRYFNYRIRLSRREALNVKEEHLELATKALQETLERFTNSGIAALWLSPCCRWPLARKSWPTHYIASPIVGT